MTKGNISSIFPSEPADTFNSFHLKISKFDDFANPPLPKKPLLTIEEEDPILDPRQFLGTTGLESQNQSSKQIQIPSQQCPPEGMLAIAFSLVARIEMLTLCFDFLSRAHVSARPKKNSRDRGLDPAQIRNLPRARSSTVKTYRIYVEMVETCRFLVGRSNYKVTISAQVQNQRLLFFNGFLKLTTLTFTCRRIKRQLAFN